MSHSFAKRGRHACWLTWRRSTETSSERERWIFMKGRSSRGTIGFKTNLLCGSPTGGVSECDTTTHGGTAAAAF